MDQRMGSAGMTPHDSAGSFRVPFGSSGKRGANSDEKAHLMRITPNKENLGHSSCYSICSGNCYSASPMQDSNYSNSSFKRR